MIKNNDYNEIAKETIEFNLFHKFMCKAVKCIKIPENDSDNPYYDADMYTVGQIYPIYRDVDDVFFIPQDNEDRSCFEVKWGIPLSHALDCFEPIFSY